MRTEIEFSPAKHPRWPGTLGSIVGFETKYGCVLHRSLSKFRESLGYWDVSDITTGALVAYGAYPGIEGAVAALTLRAQEFHGHPGGFSAALDRGRQREMAMRF